MKTFYIIHGWDGSPEEPLLKWLRQKLKEKGHKVVAPEMPDPEYPHIDPWVNKAKEIITPDENAVLVGHSIGCQTILRYLEGLEKEEKVRGMVLLAPWTNLKMDVIEEEGEESIAIAREWIDNTMDMKKAKEHIDDGITAIFSNDDPVVPLSEKEVFAQELNAETIVEENKGHFTEDDEVTELQSLLEAAENK